MVCNWSNTTVATSGAGAGTAYTAPEFSLGF